MRIHDIEQTFSAKLQHVLHRLVDEKVGLIRKFIVIPLQQAESSLHIYAAECADVSYAIEHNHFTVPINILSSGAAFNREEAIWSCIGEACERYTASYCTDVNLVYDSPANLGKSAVDLSTFVLFSKQQYEDADFPLYRPDENRAIHWVKATALTGGEEKYVPAQLVWLTNMLHSKEERYFTQISTGHAAGECIEHAQLGGLCEVIERDAFSTHWLLGQTPKKVPVTWITAQNNDIKTLIDSTKAEVNLLWMTTDLDVPTVMCLIKVPNHVAISVGMSSHLDAKMACEKAIVECFNTFNWTLEMERNALGPVTYDEVKDFREHVRYYLNPENHHHLDFLLAGVDIDIERLSDYQFSAPDYLTSLREVCDRVKAKGFDIWSVDISKSEFLDLGIHVNKIIVPGLQHMHAGVGLEYRDTKRLEQVARFLDITMKGTLNLSVHPFP